MNGVLVTGASGFVGGAVACELLERHPEVEPLFLARGADGLDRIRRNLARFGVAPSRVSARSVLSGGLGDMPRLADDPRTQRVTHVLNCAGHVSFAWKREVWAANVDETLAFAEAVRGLPALRRFVHVGTAMVCGMARDRVVREAEFPGDVKQLTLYTRSKAEAERRLRERFDGRLVIARPSIVVGHTRLGCAPSSSIFWLFRMIHAARQVPFAPTTRIDVVPADHCAQALVALLFKPCLAHRRYHVSAGVDTSCSFESIDAAYGAALGEPPAPLGRFDLGDLPLLERGFSETFGGCDPREASSAIRAYQAFAGLNVTFDDARLLAEGVPPPARFCDYVPLCVRTSAERSIAEQMAGDVR